ncbi:acyltransferase family protein [Photobacterium alginatilyticum]|uniref:acyltransferase family protein n=1 Tax=Photobacterium alginatilyticum TaxID=1775171 RepID=UPI0040676483
MKRVYAFDSLKLLAILAIFIIHYSIFKAYGGEVENAIYLSLNIIARFAVPFFFAIAGYLYYFQRKTDINRYTWRYLAKLIRMYICWTMIYLLISGMIFRSWYPAEFTESLFYTAFYHGTLGSEIMWFMPALTIAVLIQFIANKFNASTVLFVIASTLHLIGLSGQSYQPLLPFELFNSETNVFFVNSRDPLFFGLFYVSLGHQLAKMNAISFFKKMPWPVYLLGGILFSGLSVAEGLWLIKGHGGIIADYYLMTLPVTLSFVGLALTFPRTDKPSLFAKAGEHSGEIYLNHGVLNTMVMSLFFHMGAFTNPEINAALSNNLALQVLLVPAAFTVNLVLYFTIRKVFHRCFGKQLVSAYRESAMVLSAFWLLFLYAQDGQNGSLFDINNPVTIAKAILVCCISYYAFLRWLTPGSKQMTVPAYKHIGVAIVVSGYWLALSITGVLNSVLGIYQMDINPYLAVLSSPLVTFSALIILSVGVTLTIQKLAYSPRLEPQKQMGESY